jgi:hypothetical protein
MQNSGARTTLGPISISTTITSSLGGADDEGPLSGDVQLIYGLLLAAQYWYPGDHPSRENKLTLLMFMVLTGEGRR